MWKALLVMSVMALVLVSSAVAQHPKTVKAPVVVPSYLDRHK